MELTETETPMRLKSITVRSGVAVNSISFSYVDSAGHKRSAGPWGGSGGQPDQVACSSLLID